MFGVPESEITVKRASDKKWTITTEDGKSAEWTEQTDVQQAGIPSDKNVWDQVQDAIDDLSDPTGSDADTLRKLNELKALASSGVLSSDATVTPTSGTAATISGITWRKGLNVQVDGYGKAFNQTLLEMYGTQETPGSDADDRAKVSAATHWAIVPINTNNNDDTTIYFLIYSGGEVYSVTRNDGTQAVTATDLSSGLTKSPVTYTITPPKA